MRNVKTNHVSPDDIRVFRALLFTNRYIRVNISCQVYVWISLMINKLRHKFVYLWCNREINRLSDCVMLNYLLVNSCLPGKIYSVIMFSFNASDNHFIARCLKITLIRSKKFFKDLIMLAPCMISQNIRLLKIVRWNRLL